VVCAQDELHAARWVSLADAVGPAGFTSAPYPPLGRVFGGRVELALPPPPRPPAANGEQPELAVPLVTTYPGIEGEQLAALADAGARGLVLAGTGLANVPASLLTAIEEPSRWDIPVVVASRCRTPAADLAELGFGARIAGRVGAIGAHGMAPAKARYALMAALGDGGGVAAARDWFAAWARG
jgi:L-asparaginase